MGLLLALLSNYFQMDFGHVSLYVLYLMNMHCNFLKFKKEKTTSDQINFRKLGVYLKNTEPSTSKKAKLVGN